VKVARTEAQFLQDIIDWGERARRHGSCLTRDQFLADEKAQDAVSRCIAAIGEAAIRVTKLDPTIKSNFPEFEAEQAYAARNVLSHDYFKVDPEVLWATVQQSVPKIIAEASRILEQRKRTS